MRKYLVLVIILMSIFACKSKKTSNITTNTQQHSEADELAGLYNKLNLPYTVTDTDMAAAADTTSIGLPVISQYVPDSVFNNPFGKNRKFSIRPIGKIEQKGKESYFVTLVNDKTHSAVYLFVLDKKKFVVSMPLVTGNDNNIIHSASIDKKLSININKQWTENNALFYKRTIYAYNNVGAFTTVLTETNAGRSANAAILNPLDTFTKKYKYSGDYVKGGKNVLFVRDGKTAGEYLFYVHFESDDKGDPCGGELRGTLKMISDKAGVYTGSGDPCALNITFAANEAKVKETGSCGNFRGIKCFFNDTYIKKKEPKTASKKKMAK